MVKLLESFSTSLCNRQEKRGCRLLCAVLFAVLFLHSTFQNHWNVFFYHDALLIKEGSVENVIRKSEQLETEIRVPVVSSSTKKIFSAKDRTRKKVLIAQYSSGYTGKYSVLLNLTQPINQLYADRWGYDYYALRGPPPGLVKAMKSTNKTTFAESRSTYFKVILLLTAIQENVYDYLVLLDADALFYDFDRDILDLIPVDKLLVAHKVDRTDDSNTGNINIGVTLWNLRHPAAPSVAEQWQQRCFERIQRGMSDDDQTPLQWFLKEMTRTERGHIVQAISNEFQYGKGTFIKHFIRLDSNDWESESLERRVSKICAVWEEVCPRYSLQCPPVPQYLL